MRKSFGIFGNFILYLALCLSIKELSSLPTLSVSLSTLSLPLLTVDIIDRVEKFVPPLCLICSSTPKTLIF